ncbi:hypothetical protein VPH35_028738 [Triticum aestivum]
MISVERAQQPQIVMPVAHLPKQKSIELSKPSLTQKNGNSSWRSKVNSPPVEAAFEQFTRHLVTEWVTNLWYSRITPDKDGPEELISIVNSVLGEISNWGRSINIITLLTRDLVSYAIIWSFIIPVKLRLEKRSLLDSRRSVVMLN